MKFMKENYNIEPEEIVDAMNHLSQDELLSTPQDSMYAFFNKLGISSENIAPVKEQYLGMLKELDQVETSKGLKQNVNVEVLDPKKQKLQEMNRKLVGETEAIADENL